MRNELNTSATPILDDIVASVMGMNAPQMVIYVQPRTVYGEQKIYPACAKSEAFAAIANTATLTERTIKHIKALGYTIEVVHQVVTL